MILINKVRLLNITGRQFSLVWKSEQRVVTSTTCTPKKRSFFLTKFVPVSVGVGLLGYFRWKHNQSHEKALTNSWEVYIYTFLPLRIVSRCMGALCSIEIPVFLRPKIYNFYIKSYGVDLSECSNPNLSDYKSLSDFFIRPIRAECRPVFEGDKYVTSPADGRVLNFGKINKCQVEQVKGVTYSLPHFLGEETWKEHRVGEPPMDKIVNESVSLFMNQTKQARSDDSYINFIKHNSNTELYQVVVYLAPGDYHRFHSPVTWHVDYRRHFQGKLLSVNPLVAKSVEDLFSLNERAVYFGEWQHGFFSLTAVGATNVGSIRVLFDSSLHTNRWTTKPRFIDKSFYNENDKNSRINLKKGDLFGEFRLGSTIVLIFEAPKNFNFNIEIGQKIKYGEKLGSA